MESVTTPKRVPGEEGLWIVIGGDLAVFSIFFGYFAHARSADAAGFEHAQEALSLGVGLLGTLVLLTGSLLVALAVQRVRGGEGDAAAKFMRAGALSGLAFLALKALDWRALFAEGVSAYDHSFFTLFFAFTGVHAFHVLIGGIVLAVAAARMRASPQDSLVLAEGAGVFWHLVDLLWIVLFALFYLS